MIRSCRKQNEECDDDERVGADDNQRRDNDFTGDDDLHHRHNFQQQACP